jgi:N,N-dimethylformamidase
MVHCSGETFVANVVRLTGEVAPRESEPAHERMPSGVDGQYPGVSRRLPLGSYLKSEADRPLVAKSGFTLQAWIWPTAPTGRAQAVIALSADGQRDPDVVLGSDTEGHWTVELHQAGGSWGVQSEEVAIEREWYHVVAGLDAATGTLWLSTRRLSIWAERTRAEVDTHVPAQVEVSVSAIYVAAAGLDASQSPVAPIASFNGKIANPAIWARSLRGSTGALFNAGSAGACPMAFSDLIIGWDFGAQFSSSAVAHRATRRFTSRLVNGPTRAVTGPHWARREVDFRLVPAEYNAIHFHDDDLDDARWPAAFSLDIPEDWPSGVYAVRVESDDSVDFIPLIVTPSARATEHPAIAVLLPTMSYVAYANEHSDTEDLGPMRSQHAQMMPAEAQMLSEVERFINDELPFRCVYDHHRDGSTCCYSSWRRPLLAIRPNFVFGKARAHRHFAADLYLIGWLERHGIDYEVVTDHDLHAAGAELAARYEVMILGSHPEYGSREVVEALEQFVECGGNIMHLGGNPFHWVTSVDAERPYVIEVRRAHVGTRTGDCGPGEERHSTTGLYGGLWHHAGRAPHKLLGVGCSGFGWADAAPYKIDEGARSDPRTAFALEGVSGEAIGDYGPLGGTAGDEIDRVDRSWGSPPETRRIASSAGLHSDYYTPTIEDYPQLPVPQGGSNPKVAAEIALTASPGGGEVFSVGSMMWRHSLASQYDGQAIDTITRNVLRRFCGE